MPITEASAYTNRFNCVLLPEERGKLQALAEDAGLKESEIVRRLIEAAYAERFGKKKAPEPRPKYNSASAREAIERLGARFEKHNARVEKITSKKKR